LASLSPATVILDAAPSECTDARPLDIDSWPIILTDRLLSDGRHIVLGDIDGFHHIWLRDVQPTQPLAYVIVRDAAIDMRLAAVQRFDRRLAGAPPLGKTNAFRPAPRQLRRLNLLLDILDALHEPGVTKTSYDIAQRLLYRDLKVARGVNWKSSTERRRTMRLIEQARSLMNDGYRDLLRGPVKG
jgi:hypothetical protein